MPAILHDERDWIIPVTDGQAPYDSSSDADKTPVAVPGAGHNDLMLIGRRPCFDFIARAGGVAAGTS